MVFCHGFNESFTRCYDYVVSHNYISSDQKYILFPVDVYITPISQGYATVHANYQLLISSSNNVNDKFVATSYNVGQTAGNLEGHYDLWIGYTGDWSDLTGYYFTEQYSYYTLNVEDSFGMPVNNTSNVVNHWGNRWQTNLSNGNSSYLLISDYHNVAGFGGLYYSLYSSQDVLPTYYGNKFAGTGTWDDWNTLNPNYVINVFRTTYSNIVSVDSSVSLTTDSDNGTTSIIFNNNGVNTEDLNLNLDDILSTFKSTLFNLLGSLSSVILLFTVVFSWLPFEFVGLIYSGMILAITLLIIKVLRGG